jgi:hypothetical protein
MSYPVNHYLAKQQVLELQLRGQRARLAMGERSEAKSDSVTIRRSTPADIVALRRLAQLDSQHPPSQPVLVAELGGEIVAALALETGIIVANPFQRTAQVVALLRLRADQLAFTPRPARTGLRRFRLGRAVADAPSS